MSSSLEENFERLKLLCLRVMESGVGSLYVGMLNELAADREENGVRFLGFMRAPAAKGNHHAVEGGLVLHLLEMWDVWVRMGSVFPLEVSGQIDGNLVLQAIINHDLHKGYMTFSVDEGGAFIYANSTPTQMLSTDMQSIYLLMQAGIKPSMQVLNAHSLAEGGWSKNPPKSASVLSKVCYLLDEMSGNVLNRLQTGKLFDTRGICSLSPA